MLLRSWIKLFFFKNQRTSILRNPLRNLALTIAEQGQAPLENQRLCFFPLVTEVLCPCCVPSFSQPWSGFRSWIDELPGTVAGPKWVGVLKPELTELVYGVPMARGWGCPCPGLHSWFGRWCSCDWSSEDKTANMLAFWSDPALRCPVPSLHNLPRPPWEAGAGALLLRPHPGRVGLRRNAGPGLCAQSCRALAVGLLSLGLCSEDTHGFKLPLLQCTPGSGPRWSVRPGIGARLPFLRLCVLNQSAHWACCSPVKQVQKRAYPTELLYGLALVWAEALWQYFKTLFNVYSYLEWLRRVV